MNDQSHTCSEWSDRKLYSEIDAAMVRALAAETSGLRLGFLASARALLGILCDRASSSARIPVKDD